MYYSKIIINVANPQIRLKRTPLLSIKKSHLLPMFILEKFENNLICRKNLGWSWVPNFHKRKTIFRYNLKIIRQSRIRKKITFGWCSIIGRIMSNQASKFNVKSVFRHENYDTLSTRVSQKLLASYKHWMWTKGYIKTK